MAAHVLDRGAGLRTRREERSALVLLRHVDIVLVAATLSLAALGVVVVYAATRGDFPLEPTYYAKRQLVFCVVGFLVMVVVAAVDFRRIAHWAGLLYGAVLLLLLAVLAVGRSVAAGTGAVSAGVAQRWISLGPVQVQPSEFAVLAVIGLLAVSLGGRADLRLRRLLAPLGLTAVVGLLIVKQPDLGTAGVLLVVVLAMLVVAGVKVRHLLLLLALGGLAFFAGVELHLVHASQLQRLTSFLHPSSGAMSDNYQEDLAKQAIGSGGLKGTGLFDGLYTNLNYVPEQSTDFIFATVGEQLGFVGSAAIIGLYLVIVLRMLRAAQAVREPVGRLLCVGVMAFLAFSVFQNIGMNIGLMPVTGIPLPFISYGGSAIVVFFTSVGVVLNVEMRRHRYR